MLRHLPMVVCLALISSGCGSEPYQTAPISGRVTVNGQGYAKIAVMFQPVSADKNNNPGPGSTGITDADGHYTLNLVGKETKGAVVGTHKVWITNFTEPDDPGADDGPQKRAKPAIEIPGRYSYMAPKPLEFVVPAGGSSSADFQLTAP